jgi:hypothetical protein
VKVPDGFGGAEVFVGGGGAYVGALVVGAAVARFFFGAAFFVGVLDGNGLAEGVIDGVLTVGATGEVLATVMPAT